VRTFRNKLQGGSSPIRLLTAAMIWQDRAITGASSMASMDSVGSPEARLRAELDGLPLTRLHVLLLLGCCIALAFDLAEISFGNILSAIFSAPPHSASSWELGLLISSVYIGAAVGAPLMGWIGDAYGRRTALIIAMLWLSIVSFCAAVSFNNAMLVASRLAAGLSLGAYPPLMFALLTDILPPRRRGALIVTATAIGYVGPTAFIFFVRFLSSSPPFGIDAWRWGFLLAGLGAALSAAAFWCLPESPRWLIAKGHLARAAGVIGAFKKSERLLPSDVGMLPAGEKANARPAERSLLGEAAFLLTIYFLSPWPTVGFTLLSGAVLIAKGMNVQDSLLYVGISTFGPILGTLGGGLFVDRFERKTFLVVTALGMGLVGLIFGASEVPIMLVGTALIFNVLFALFLPMLVLYAAEITSTVNRAKLTSWAWTANRVGSALVPLVLLPILHSWGPIAMFALISASTVLFVVIVSCFGPRGAAGRNLR